MDAIENLVVADEACNGAKTDHLAASVHVHAWRERLASAQGDLTQIANAVSWESNPERTLGVARALYLPLPAGARLWSQADGLVPADLSTLRALLAA